MKKYTGYNVLDLTNDGIFMKITEEMITDIDTRGFVLIDLDENNTNFDLKSYVSNYKFNQIRIQIEFLDLGDCIVNLHKSSSFVNVKGYASDAIILSDGAVFVYAGIYYWTETSDFRLQLQLQPAQLMPLD